MTRLLLLSLSLLLPVTHAASRAHKNRCSDAVRVVRGGVGFVYEKEPVDSRKVDEAERHIARYKLPKAFVRVDDIVRSPSGKADYRWAKQTAIDAVG